LGDKVSFLIGFLIGLIGEFMLLYHWCDN